MNKRVLLSTLWILAVFNYIFRFLFSQYYLYCCQVEGGAE